MKMMIALTFAAMMGFAHCAANAADVTVLSGGAVEPGLHAAVAQFEKSTGHHVKITFNTAPQIQTRIEGGDRFDVLVAPPAAMDAFVKSGGSITEIVLYRDKGLKLVGLLPADVQNYTSYTAALTTSGKASSAARDLVAYLGTVDAKKALAANGVE